MCCSILLHFMILIARRSKGIGIKLGGNLTGTQTSYTITIDGQAMDASSSADLNNATLFSVTNLANAEHNLTLVVQTDSSPDALFQFDYAEISAAIPSSTNVSR